MISGYNNPRKGVGIRARRTGPALDTGISAQTTPWPEPHPSPFTHRFPRDRRVWKQVRERVESAGSELLRSQGGEAHPHKSQASMLAPFARSASQSSKRFAATAECSFLQGGSVWETTRWLCSGVFSGRIPQATPSINLGISGTCFGVWDRGVGFKVVRIMWPVPNHGSGASRQAPWARPGGWARSQHRGHRGSAR